MKAFGRHDDIHSPAHRRSPRLKTILLTFCLTGASMFVARAADKIKVASFSTIDTEIVQQVGGDHVEVAALVKPGVDPHEYEPTPSDLREVSGARLILTSGKHMENYLNKLQEATKIIRDELIKLDSADKADFEANANGYVAKLDALENWVKRKVAELPRDKRKLITSHDAFQYFARDYGFMIAAIEGISPETEA